MAKKLYLMRLLVALFFFATIFTLSLIFTTFRIISSETISRNIAAISGDTRLQEVKVETDTTTKPVFVNNHDFWKEYYNDDRFGRSWNFNISQKYDASRLREYQTVVVKQMDVGRPGEMGKCGIYCERLYVFTEVIHLNRKRPENSTRASRVAIAVVPEIQFQFSGEQYDVRSEIVSRY